jgi:CRP/FNR family transcriptional regulator, anaerobic regulatory protein
MSALPHHEDRHGSVDLAAGGPVRSGRMPIPRVGHLGELLRLLGAAADPCGDPVLMMDVWRLRPGAVLQHEGMTIDTLHAVRSGSLKCQRTLEDGYEQVLALAQAGDLIGVEALHHGRASASAVALEDCTVYALHAADIAPLRRDHPAFEQALWLGVSRQLARVAQTADMMAAVSSEVRLARFLLWMSDRMQEIGQSPRRLNLRIGRRDIASLLGVAHETVSRSFSALADSGCIRVDNRDVEIIDAEALHAKARATRGPTPAARPAAALSPLRPDGARPPGLPTRAAIPDRSLDRSPALAAAWWTGATARRRA